MRIYTIIVYTLYARGSQTGAGICERKTLNAYGIFKCLPLPSFFVVYFSTFPVFIARPVQRIAVITVVGRDAVDRHRT